MHENIPSELLRRAGKIRLMGMDIDGVLTGGEIIVLESREEVKIWNVKDRFAFYLSRRAGDALVFAWITGRKSRQVSDRAKEIGIHELVQDCMKKREAMEQILSRNGISPEEAVFIGDDLVDVPVFRSVGLAICPADAPDEVKKEAHYISPYAGGKGVLRDAVELVLKARGLWPKATEGYL